MPFTSLLSAFHSYKDIAYDLSARNKPTKISYEMFLFFIFMCLYVYVLCCIMQYLSWKGYWVNVCYLNKFKVIPILFVYILTINFTSQWNWKKLNWGKKYIIEIGKKSKRFHRGLFGVSSNKTWIFCRQSLNPVCL